MYNSVVKQAWLGGFHKRTLKSEAGWTFVGMFKLLVFLCVMSVASWAFHEYILNNVSVTEDRAYNGAYNFIEENGMTDKVDRVSCAGDLDGDRYGTCAVKMKSGEVLTLECPTGWFSRHIGVNSCKEIFAGVNILDQGTVRVVK